MFYPVGDDFDLASTIMTFTLQQDDQMVPVPFIVIDDNIFEGRETIILSLSIPSNSRALLGAVTSTTISIGDNEGIHQKVDFGFLYIGIHLWNPKYAQSNY